MSADRWLIISADQASYEAWLADEQESAPLPIPASTSVEATYTVPVRISTGIVVYRTRRVIRSIAPVLKGTTP